METHFGLVYYVQDGAVAIERLREQHDPTANVIAAHVGVLFPVPASVGQDVLEGHVERVLAGVEAFEISLAGFSKSADHWLFLLVDEGKQELQGLYRALYAGPLAKFRRDDIPIHPHVGLGLFLKPGVVYDWESPNDDDFEDDRYRRALAAAKAADFGDAQRVDSLHLIVIDGEVMSWMTGQRRDLSADARVRTMREYPLRSSD